MSAPHSTHRGSRFIGTRPGIIFHGGRGTVAESTNSSSATRGCASVGRAWGLLRQQRGEASWLSLGQELVHRYRIPDRPSSGRAIFAGSTATTAPAPFDHGDIPAGGAELRPKRQRARLLRGPIGGQPSSPHWQYDVG